VTNNTYAFHSPPRFQEPVPMDPGWEDCRQCGEYFELGTTDDDNFCSLDCMQDFYEEAFDD